MVTQIAISKSSDNKVNVSLPYNPAHIAKLKSIKGYRWHPEKKYWSFPESNGTLKKILKVFDGEEIRIDPALQAKLPVTGSSTSVFAKHKVPKQSQK